MKINLDNTPYIRNYYQTTSPDAPAAAETNAAAPPKMDFTNMTRQELRVWLKEQLSTAKMTFRESFPFVAMTLDGSAAAGRPADTANDTEKVDFIAKLRLDIEDAAARSDKDAARKLEAALDVVLRCQGRASF